MTRFIQYLLCLSITLLMNGLAVASNNIDAAAEAFQGQKWGEAAESYQALCEENPYNGLYWYRLAVAQYYMKEYEASISAYQNAADVGYEPGTCFYNMACDYALLGQSKKAVAMVELAIQNGLRNREQLIREDTDLDSIRDTKLFRERVLPAVADNASRTKGWRTDLEYMSKRMEETHYDLYKNISRDEWQKAVKRISKDIPNLEDHEVIVELKKLIARVGDGHTSFQTPAEGKYRFHAIPAKFYIFKDGVFILSAYPEYAEALGKRVVRVGNVSVDEALARTATVTQRDNAMQIKWLAPKYMSAVEILHGLDIIDELDHVDVVVAGDDGEESTVRFEPVELTHDLMRSGILDFDVMNKKAVEPLPLWLKDYKTAYWFEYLEDEKLVYFQFNRVRNAHSGETIAEFATRLFDFIDKNDVGALVVDVRLNNGGNNYLTRSLISGVIRSDKINKHGNLFVITGRETFSACQNFVNRLERDTQVMFVGEPTGSRPNFVGEGNPIRLPYSGLTVNGSSLYWQDTRSDDVRHWIAPALVAETTSEDFRTNRDPALETIRAYRTKQRQANQGAMR